MSVKKKKRLADALLDANPKPDEYALPPPKKQRGTPKWGVEVEVEPTDKDRSYTDDDDTPRGWQQVDDGSIGNGREYRSRPPWTNLSDGWEAIDRLHVHLNGEFDATQRCGFHMHVDESAVTPEPYALNIAQIEYLFYAALPPDRWRGSYCKGAIDHEGRRCKPWDTGDRYLGVNTQARSRHRTIELRYHSGTRNPEKIRAWTWLQWSLYLLASESTRSLTTLADEIVAVTALSADPVAGVAAGWTHMLDSLPGGREYKPYWIRRLARYRNNPIYTMVPHYMAWRRDTARAAKTQGHARHLVSVPSMSEEARRAREAERAARERRERAEYEAYVAMSRIQDIDRAERRAYADIMALWEQNPTEAEAEAYRELVTREPDVWAARRNEQLQRGEPLVGPDGEHTWCPGCRRYHISPRGTR